MASPHVVADEARVGQGEDEMLKTASQARSNKRQTEDLRQRRGGRRTPRTGPLLPAVRSAMIASMMAFL